MVTSRAPHQDREFLQIFPAHPIPAPVPQLRSVITRMRYGVCTAELPLRLRSVASSSPQVSILHIPGTDVLRTLTDHAHTCCRCTAYAFIPGINPPRTIFLRFNTSHTPCTDPSRPQSNRLQTRHEPAVGPFRPATNVNRAH